MIGTMPRGTIATEAARDAVVVVLDAAGVIGRGLVAAALEAGHAAVAGDRHLPGLAALAAQHPQQALIAVPGSARDESAARDLAQALRALERPVSAVVAAIDAGRLRGRLLDQTPETTCAALQASLTPQLAAARHLLPLLGENEGGSFVLIGGPGGRHPWAGYGQRSLAEAALRMLARVLHDEARPIGVRVQLLSVDTPTCGLHAGPPRAHWPSALQIGQRAMQLLAPGGNAEAVVEFALPQPAASAHAAIARATGAAKPARAQAADSGQVLLPSGCLQDARKLLRTLPASNPDTPARSLVAEHDQRGPHQAGQAGSDQRSSQERAPLAGGAGRSERSQARS
ncbi:MAG TPA: SDR family oxidoreductase [Xanthomonadaceae bacterium]|nr:SDR family oxidoreductase [Xanthomonadaceae bacterium]